MDYRKNPSDNDQSWLESSADNSAIRWHGFDNLNNGKDKFFKADILPNNPNSGNRMLAGVYGEHKGLGNTVVNSGGLQADLPADLNSDL